MACPYAGQVSLSACPHARTGQTMKAIVVEKFGGPENMHFRRDMPVPIVGDNQVLIKVMTIGVNPLEVIIREGVLLSKYFSSLPYIPGGDVCGFVEQLGKNVTKFKLGDPVYTVSITSVNTAYAEFGLFEVKEVFPLPSNLNISQGAALGLPYFTAYHALIQRAKGKAGDTVFVHGASGGVGIACCQIAHASGMNVIGTAGSAKGLALILKNGASAAFNHNEEGYVDKIKKHLENQCQNINIILEMNADKNLVTDESLLTSRGKICVIGVKGRTGTVDLLTLNFKELDVLGIELLHIPNEDIEEISSYIADGCEAGWLRPVISSEYPLHEAQQAHKEIQTHPGGSSGKIILSNA